MATYKAEFLSHYYKRRLRPRAAYAMGLIPFWARTASRAPRAINLLARTAVAKRAAEIAPARTPPQFAPETFVRWFEKRPAGRSGGPGLPEVVVWPDTFTNFFRPEQGRAAVEVLEAAGFRVRVAHGAFCCGRPLYDFGMLSLAKQLLRTALKSLEKDIVTGTPVLVLEPSCAAVFRDELPNLLHGDENARRLSGQTVILSELLDRHAEDWSPPRLKRPALVHGHCHHKAVFGFDAEKSVIDRLGLDARFTTSECCGMAGSFGYERGERYEVSMALLDKLLPTVRSAPEGTLLIADGFSCQEQIAHGTGRLPIHLAQALRMAIAEASPSQQ
jgi:Fe-S oxidoreductase